MDFDYNNGSYADCIGCRSYWLIVFVLVVRF